VGTVDASVAIVDASVEAVDVSGVTIAVVSGPEESRIPGETFVR